ncbi:hypothetical protein BKA63DRAFT_575582 [Paraphoma chrysanthemicola]|nr:hypothetical protein BKA63DRAFT_575582 [Paraphoma chrysanthemicola]
MNFINKIIVVTGAARGIRSEVAKEYASQGGVVVLVDVNRSELEVTTEFIRSAGHNAHAFACDVSSNEDVNKMVEEIIENIGLPDVVHNNAVLVRSGSVLDLAFNNAKRMFNINVLSYLRMTQSFAPAMIPRGKGRWFANTVSPNGLMPANPAIANLACYSICKAANISLSQSAAITLKPHNIGVSILFPDIVYTKSVHELSRTASEEFTEGFVNFLTKTGTYPTATAKKLVQERKRKNILCQCVPRV